MQGAGNDYIYFNCFEGEIENPGALSVRLSDRHFGIGGDGVVLIGPSSVADARMRMFNADGSEGKMCGNAIRCVGKFLYMKGICRKKELKIETLSGIKSLKLNFGGKADLVSVDMGKPVLKPELIPVQIANLTNKDKIINHSVFVEDKNYNITCVSMGNPHCVLFCKDIDGLDIEKEGKKFEKNSIFPEGVNTEFVEIKGQNTLKMRVWERGSGETLACGTGACASVVAAVENGYLKKGEDITVILRGGKLLIKYTDDGVIMTGEAEMVFEGEINI
jgi:diaminopimelate epimerase